MRNLLIVCATLLLTVLPFHGDQPTDPRVRAQKKMTEGNWKDAYDLYAEFIFQAEADPGDLHQAVQCLLNLNRDNETEALREKFAATHAGNWRALAAVAQSYLGANHFGFMISGAFERGGHRGGGLPVNSVERDRVRALQLMEQARALAAKNATPAEQAQLCLDMARVFFEARSGGGAWQLQALTDITTLPDYEEGHPHWYWQRGQEFKGAPVDEKGEPVYYQLPESFETAKNDGERWRWLLWQAMELNPGLRDHVLTIFANFLHSQFGVQTMVDYWFWWARGRSEEDQQKTEGRFALHTLADNETVCRTAAGIKRFKLPDEFDFIRIYRELNATEQLARIYTDRRQYPRAVEYWRETIKRDGPGHNNYRELALKQIVDKWGQFDPVMAQPAGTGATVDYRFRNGHNVEFRAQRLRVRELLADVKDYLRSNPDQLKWEQVEIGELGHRIVIQNQSKYIGEEVAKWSVKLHPLPDHFDRRITVHTPLREPGAYLVTATMDDGNTSHIVIWVHDTVVVKKPLADQDKGGPGNPAFVFVADARTGEPVGKANVEFFGYRTEWKDAKIGRGRHIVHTTNFAEFSDAEGQVFPRQKDIFPDDHGWQWIITATTEDGRLAYLGFSSIWHGQYYDYEYQQVKTYAITDRPVYRPGQTVKFNLWVRHAKYDLENDGNAAGPTAPVRIDNPKGENAFAQDVKANPDGSFSGEFTLPKDAPLGVYNLHIPNLGGVTFRVEEYKKPEFEVTVEAPTEPVALGEQIPATIKAKYYFGAPVVKAKVKYKVTRVKHDVAWYAPAPWDWFYGPGYWWFCGDYLWYPGWYRWGCWAPRPWWIPWQPDPPEVVMEGEQPIGEDGTLKLTIDSSLAKEIHGDHDHRYQITAEVTDESRRTIVGQGNVMAAREPFKVYAWVNYGYFRAGDVVQASFNTRTPDGQPVAGKAVATLYSIRYGKGRDAKPVEKAEQEWKLDVNDRGEASLKLTATKPGQYRLACRVTDAAGHTQEGAYVFVVRGEGFDGRAFRFNQLELTPDKQDYEPGDTVKLMINTDQEDSTVLLFLRPANGIYLPPQVLHLKGKSTVVPVAIVKRDMPNFFIEAVTVSGGRVYTETREIVVPPEKRVLNVDVLPSATEYKPGAPAKVKIRLTDFFGEPFKGSTVVTVYDKSVEYISGGSNVPEIKEFFWKWRRTHHPQTEHNLQRYSANLIPPGKLGMSPLGVFGEQVADDAEGGLRRDNIPRSRLAKSGREARYGMSEVAAATATIAMESDAMKDEQSGMAGPEQPAAPVTVRKEFADTAFWVAALQTDDNGIAEVEFKMPENLTGWKIRTWAMGGGTRVGEGTAEVVTTKNLLLRLQAPRFFVEKDEVVLSANIHSYLKTDQPVTALLEFDGDCLEPITAAQQKLTIKAGSEQRVDWRVKAVREGEAVVRMKALGRDESDAMQMTFPVYVHGMLKTESFSVAIRPDQQSATIKLRVPAERRPDQSRLEVRYSPTLAGALVDALPYLVEYPYGCTEQTLNRFVPTVITHKVLQNLGVDLKAIREKRTNLNAQEIGDPQQRAAQWQRWQREPVWDEAVVNDMVREGIKRLADMQCRDGGWGWFSGWGEQSYPHTTVVVVRGLMTARDYDVAVPPDLIERGLAWLKNYQAEQVRLIKKPKDGKEFGDDLDALVFTVLAEADFLNDDMADFLYRDRNRLSVYSKAMLGVAFHELKQIERRDMLVQNVEQHLVSDDENQTVYLNLGNGGYWWCWYGDEIEAHAWYLKLLNRVDPKSQKASRLVKYLLNNRKHSTYWNSTRDTALCIEAMAEYLKASGEDKPDMTVQIKLDGKVVKEVRITADDLFVFDNTLVLEGQELTDGAHTLEIIREGKGPVYANAYLENFTLEDPITRAGLEIKVNRRLFKLVPAEKKVLVQGERGQAVQQKVEKYNRVAIAEDTILTSGDLVEVELELESKNDYEYLVFEDFKPAGCEPVEVRSGYTGNEIGAYVEFRDERTAFLVRALARGKHSVSYRLRAEIPGKFSALPARGHAMYAPELRANSDEDKLRIEDR